MIPTIALESTATTIGTTATRDQCDDQCVGVKEDTPVADLYSRHQCNEPPYGAGLTPGVTVPLQWNYQTGQSSRSRITDGKVTVAGYLSYRLLLELRIRQGQVAATARF